MTSFFISDIHLSPTTPALTALFIDFIQGPATQAERLYILGDLFNAWVGEDIDSEWMAGIVRVLRSRKEENKLTYFICGNRDFLIDAAFCEKAGMVLLQDPTVIEIEGRPVLLSHGDQYCTADRAYQRYRRWVHCPLIQGFFRRLPRAIRLRIAKSLRGKSKAHARTLTPITMDVEPSAIVCALERYSVDCMIHGHVHRPAVHTHESGSRHALRYVLGDWGDTGSIICSEGRHLHLMRFDPRLGIQAL